MLNGLQLVDDGEEYGWCAALLCAIIIDSEIVSPSHLLM